MDNKGVEFLKIGEDCLIKSNQSLFKWSQVIVVHFNIERDDCTVILKNNVKVAETKHFFNQLKKYASENFLILRAHLLFAPVQSFVCIGMFQKHLRIFFIENVNFFIEDDLLDDCFNVLKKETFNIIKENEMMKAHIQCMPNGLEFLEFMKDFNEKKIN